MGCRWGVKHSAGLTKETHILAKRPPTSKPSTMSATVCSSGCLSSQPLSYFVAWHISTHKRKREVAKGQSQSNKTKRFAFRTCRGAFPRTARGAGRSSERSRKSRKPENSDVGSGQELSSNRCANRRLE